MKRLSYPIRSKFFERAGDPYVKVSLCSLQGRRPSMEDSAIIRLNLPSHPNYHLFGIFDGHHGKGAAKYLSENIANELDKLSDLKDAKAIQDCILNMDKKFCQMNQLDEGSCLVFVLVKPVIGLQSGQPSNQSSNEKAGSVNDATAYEVSVFWAGDSRCLWLSPDKSKGITKDHVPTDPKEKQRIENAEGEVVRGRVDARLAMSRAFGDQSLKENQDKSITKQKIVALCDHQNFTAMPGDWLLLYCDGLVETWTDQELVEKLKKNVNDYEDPAHALGYLFDEILNAGSGDNMTACLIQLQNGLDHGIGVKNKTFLPGPLYTVRHDNDFVKAYMDNASNFGHVDNPKLRIAAYQEDINFLNRFSRNDPDFRGIIKEIEDSIRQLQDEIGPDESSDKDMLSYNDSRAIKDQDKNMENRNIDKRNMDNKNLDTINNQPRRRKITLDQWVYTYNNF